MLYTSILYAVQKYAHQPHICDMPNVTTLLMCMTSAVSVPTINYNYSSELFEIQIENSFHILFCTIKKQNFLKIDSNIRNETDTYRQINCAYMQWTGAYMQVYCAYMQILVFSSCICKGRICNFCICKEFLHISSRAYMHDMQSHCPTNNHYSYMYIMRIFYHMSSAYTNKTGRFDSLLVIRQYSSTAKEL